MRHFLGIDVYKTYESLLSSHSLLLVSNGGADDSRGSTGWIVSDDIGQRLIQGSGSVPGLYPRSYCAEGYAMVGGANDSRGSTGWIVSDDIGQRLMQGSGSVPGLYPRSYCAEGYAMVSGLTVLKQGLFCGHIELHNFCPPTKTRERWNQPSSSRR
jgi:hypothetical protein